MEQLTLVEIEGSVEAQANLGFSDDVYAAIEPLVIDRILVLVQKKVALDGQYQKFYFFSGMQGSSPGPMRTPACFSATRNEKAVDKSSVT